MVILLIVAGLVFGSFINALVWRMHQQLKVENRKLKGKKPTSPQNEYSILTGRSMCPHCKHVLAAGDLIPIFSWLSLRGKCRYCKKPIAWQYPLVEALTAIGFVVSFVAWPAHLGGLKWLTFGLWLLILVCFIALSVYDLRWKLLPNRLVLPTTLLSAAYLVSQSLADQSLGNLAMGLLAALTIAGFFYLLFVVSNGNWIGGGDVKLAVALGLIAGTPLKAILIIFLASFLGTLAALPFLLTKKIAKSHQVPFGPFLLLAAAIIVLYGPQIIGFYEQQLLGV